MSDPDDSVARLLIEMAELESDARKAEIAAALEAAANGGPPQQANAFTLPREREEAIAKMKRAKDGFYFMATQVDDHRFVEFAGLMNEYIKLCEATHAKGYDLTEVYRVMQNYNAKYVGEKIGCIYGSAFYREPKNMLGFLQGLLDTNEPGLRIVIEPDA